MALVDVCHDTVQAIPLAPLLESIAPLARIDILTTRPNAHHSRANATWIQLPVLHGMAMTVLLAIRLVWLVLVHHYQTVLVVTDDVALMLALWPVRRLGGRTVLVTDRTLSLPPRERSWRAVGKRFWLQAVLNQIDRCVVPGEALRTVWLNEGLDPGQVVVWYALPPLAQLQALRYDLSLPEGTRRYLVVASCEESGADDWEQIIRAVLLARATIPSIVLVLKCRAEDEGAVQILVRQMEAQEYVLITPADGNDSVQAIPTEAKAIIVPPACGDDPVIPVVARCAILLGIPLLLPSGALWLDDSVQTCGIPYDGESSAAIALALTRLGNDRAWQAENVRRIQITSERWQKMYTLQRLAAFLLSQREDVIPRPLPLKPRTDAIPPYHPDASLPLRITPPPRRWRIQRQMQREVTAWATRIIPVVLLVVLPIISSFTPLGFKILTLALVGVISLFLLNLPPGEAAIIVALFFIVQRSLFLRFPAEGLLGPVLIYLGTFLQLVIFVGFFVRAVIHQRPLQRTGFLFWPVMLYLGWGTGSAIVNHVAPLVALIGLEHTLHNLIFVLLIAEDLPSPQQLRRYVVAITSVLGLLAAFSIALTLNTQPFQLPIALILPDADSYAYLLLIGTLLACGTWLSLLSDNGDEADWEGAPFSRWAPLGFGLATGLLAVALFLTQSLMNWLGLLCGVLVIALLQQRGRWQVLAFGLAGGIGIACWLPNNRTTKGATSYLFQIQHLIRGDLPHHAPLGLSLRVVRDHLLWGTGPGRFGGTVAALTHSPVYQQYHFVPATAMQSINLFWLHISGETGLVGLGLYLGLMGLTLRTIWQGYHWSPYGRWYGITVGVFALVIAFSSATFFGNALEVDSLSAPFWGFIGIAVALPRSQHGQHEKDRHEHTVASTATEGPRPFSDHPTHLLDGSLP